MCHPLASRCRFRLFAMTVALLTALPGTMVHASENEVNLDGRFVQRKTDYLVGYVSSTLRNRAVITLGYRHGIRENTRLLVVRRVDDRYQPVGWVLTATPTNDRSLVRATMQDLELKVNDLALVPAEDLMLWDGNTPADQRIVRQKYMLRRNNGYNTRFRAVDGKTVLREIQAEKAKRQAFWAEQLKRDAEDEETGYGTQTNRDLEVETDGVGIEAEQYPSEQEWLTARFRDTVAEKWIVMPQTYDRVNINPNFPSSLELIRNEWQNLAR